MTLQRTIDVTRDRQLHLDLPVPKSIPIGKAQIKIVFAAYSNASKIPVKKGAPRENWGKAFAEMNKNNDDKLCFADNRADFEWEW